MTLTSNYQPTFGAIDSKMNQWVMKLLVKNGKVPSDLSVKTGSENLALIWRNLKDSAANDVREYVNQIWIQAVSIEKSVTLQEAIEIVASVKTARGWNFGSVAVEYFDSEVKTEATPTEQTESGYSLDRVIAMTEATSTAPLTEEETAAAEAVKKFAQTEPLNLQIIHYTALGYPTGSLGFCNTIGVHTSTMSARLNRLRELAKPENGQTLQKRLIRILNLKFKRYGGQSKVE